MLRVFYSPQWSVSSLHTISHTYRTFKSWLIRQCKMVSHHSLNLYPPGVVQMSIFSYFCWHFVSPLLLNAFSCIFLFFPLVCLNFPSWWVEIIYPLWRNIRSLAICIANISSHLVAYFFFCGFIFQTESYIIYNKIHSSQMQCPKILTNTSSRETIPTECEV